MRIHALKKFKSNLKHLTQKCVEFVNLSFYTCKQQNKKSLYIFSRQLAKLWRRKAQFLKFKNQVVLKRRYYISIKFLKLFFKPSLKILYLYVLKCIFLIKAWNSRKNDIFLFYKFSIMSTPLLQSKLTKNNPYSILNVK